MEGTTKQRIRNKAQPWKAHKMMDTETEEIQNRCRKIIMAEVEIRDAGDGGGP